MAKFLVVFFDRYDTNKSKHQVVEASDHKQAIGVALQVTDPEFSLQELDDFCCGLFEQVNEQFACVSFEEEDILIYSI